MREETYRYWGLYCPQHNRWLVRTNGSFVQFSAPAIAEAFLKTEIDESNRHLWQVTEFGQEKPVDYRSLEPGQSYCTA